ncbi:hypothetical protein MMC22_000793 [Lobaria immixta]|nr:hypothetical protein [Lobaria immixta]
MSASMPALRELLGIDDYERVHDGVYFDVNQASVNNAIDHNVNFDHQTSMANISPNSNNPIHPGLALDYHATLRNASDYASVHASGALQGFTAPQTEDSQRASADQSSLYPLRPHGSKQNLPTLAGNASKLKRSLSIATGKNAAGNVRVVAELDPENQEIVRLHQNDNLNWSQIAKRLNQKRIAVGREPTLTANAIYSRYSRNAPRIAAAKGEIWDPEQVVNVSKKKAKMDEPITGFDDAEDELLVKARHEIEEETWELVSKRIVEKGGREHTAEMCARRYYFL